MIGRVRKTEKIGKRNQENSRKLKVEHRKRLF